MFVISAQTRIVSNQPHSRVTDLLYDSAHGSMQDAALHCVAVIFCLSLQDAAVCTAMAELLQSVVTNTISDASAAFTVLSNFTVSVAVMT